jgi:CYTH domain-containing protein
MPPLHLESPPPPDAPDVRFSSSQPKLEIERKFLLDRLPQIPSEAGGVEVIRIEQGYFCKEGSSVCPIDMDVLEGRIRRATAADGRVTHTHTVKTGSGLVRHEVERPISARRFEQQWPLTEGRRLAKVRYRVPHEGYTWEIDHFPELEVVLAEVELPAVDAAPPVPDWLAPHVVREVTDDPDYRNYALARQLTKRRKKLRRRNGG